MDVLVTDGSLGLSLTHQVLQVILKAVCVFQEAHGYVIICVAVLQPREKRARKENSKYGQLEIPNYIFSLHFFFTQINIPISIYL